MHFDYLAFNMVGHTCYMVYNVGLYSVTSVKEEYQRRHPFGANPIAINDIFFPVHAVILCLIAIKPLARNKACVLQSSVLQDRLK